MTPLSFSVFTRPSELHYEAIAAYLQSMLDLAEGPGSQSACAQRILLALYRPHEHKMSGADFTGLDVPHLHHAVHLLHEHGMCRKSIFGLSPEAENRIQKFADSKLGYS